ncbi:hypothetical protein SprV_0100440200 [Sparganum proliferum]
MLSPGELVYGPDCLWEKSQIPNEWAEHFRSVLNRLSTIPGATIDRLPQVEANNDLDLLFSSNDAPKINIDSEHGNIIIQFTDAIVGVYNEKGWAQDGALRNTALNRYARRLPVIDAADVGLALVKLLQTEVIQLDHIQAFRAIYNLKLAHQEYQPEIIYCLLNCLLQTMTYACKREVLKLLTTIAAAHSLRGQIAIHEADPSHEILVAQLHESPEISSITLEIFIKMCGEPLTRRYLASDRDLKQYLTSVSANPQIATYKKALAWLLLIPTNGVVDHLCSEASPRRKEEETAEDQSV